MKALEPGSPDWWQRAELFLAEEATNERSWWWLSFADATLPAGSQFLGVAIVEAGGEASATVEAHRLGINPGGSVALFEIPDEHVPAPEYRNRLLNRAEAELL